MSTETVTQFGTVVDIDGKNIAIALFASQNDFNHTGYISILNSGGVGRFYGKVDFLHIQSDGSAVISFTGKHWPTFPSVGYGDYAVATALVGAPGNGNLALNIRDEDGVLIASFGLLETGLPLVAGSTGIVVRG